MNDKNEALKFYKIAYALAFKELGSGSYLWDTLSKRIGKGQSETATSTNPSDEDAHIISNKANYYKRKIMKAARRRRRIMRSKKRAAKSKESRDNFKTFSNYNNSVEHVRGSSTISNHKCSSHRSSASKPPTGSRNHQNSFLTSEEKRIDQKYSLYHQGKVSQESYNRV